MEWTTQPIVPTDGLLADVRAARPGTAFGITLHREAVQRLNLGCGLNQQREFAIEVDGRSERMRILAMTDGPGDRIAVTALVLDPRHAAFDPNI
jgi:hypothetical protein